MQRLTGDNILYSKPPSNTVTNPLIVAKPKPKPTPMVDKQVETEGLFTIS